MDIKNQLQALAEWAVNAVRSAVGEELDDRIDRLTERGRLGSEWVTNEEAIGILGVSRATLLRYRNSGALPFSKVGANIYYRARDIADLLEGAYGRRGEGR